ncbi:MAG: methylated-DNA--[protein]-cysteine S-methyltransferase [Bacillota bacterium]|nr:methylated-DNA--[protein]-cysteine S-methyltransferase [Bacillota bacterium]
MQYITHYDSPLGGILLAADEKGLTGLWFDGEKYYPKGLSPEHREGSLPVLEETKRWLDIYFNGREPDFMPALHMTGSAFQMSVWDILRKIPYGKTTTYGAIAQEIAARRGLSQMSAQAVGGAVGHNEISILVPCHRVVGSGGSLTGYAGGVDKKAALLRLEGVDMTAFSIPTKGTAIQSWWGATEA